MKRAKILNEIINAKITDVLVNEDCRYDWDRLAESNRDLNHPITITLDNGEILEVFGMMKLSDK